MHRVPVVVDINVLVAAVLQAGPTDTFESYPSPPPLRGTPAPNVLGILNDAHEFSLWLSAHILDGIARVLARVPSWSDERIQQYAEILQGIAERSGGAVVEPDVSIADCGDWEDNRILELAASVGALLLISNDRHLLEMNPWRGIPVMDADAFVRRVDAMRRLARNPVRTRGGRPPRRST